MTIKGTSTGRTGGAASAAVLAVALAGCVPLQFPVDMGTPVDMTSEDLSGVWGRTDSEQGDQVQIWFGSEGEFFTCNFPAPYVWSHSELHGDGPVSIDGYFELDNGHIYAGTNGSGRAGAPVILSPMQVDGIEVLQVQAGGDPDSSDFISFVKDGNGDDFEKVC